MSAAAIGLAIALVAPARGHAFVVGGTMKQSLLFSSTSAIGCSAGGSRCPESVGVTFADKPGLVYPASVARVWREGAEGTVAELIVKRGSLAAFVLATSAASGDAVSVPDWCGARAPTYISSIGQSGALIRIGAPTTADQDGCPMLDSAGHVVGVVRGAGDALHPHPGFPILAGALNDAGAGAGGFYDVGWQFASRDEALARAKELSASHPDFPNGSTEGLQERTIPWWCRAAELGDAPAMTVCARGLVQGRGGGNDYARAMLLAQRSRAAGFAGAETVIAEIDGTYGKRIASVPDLLARAQAGDVTAAFALASRYENGFAGPADRTQAYAWYQRCAATNPECAERVGRELLYGGGTETDVPRATQALEAAGAAGVTVAYYELGQYYGESRIVGRYDPVKARRYFELTLTSPDTTYAGSARDYLAGLPKADPKTVAAAASQPIEVRIASAERVAETRTYEAAPLFVALGATGDVRALLAAGAFFQRSSMNHWGRSSDDETALAYFKRASTAGSYRGSAEAANSGKLVTADERNRLWKLSLTQARNAAESGDADAYVYLGKNASDCRQAAMWYQRGAAKKAAGAEYELGMLYTRDARLSEAYPENPCFDVREGERWLRRAVAHEDRTLQDAAAAYRLGVLLESGRLGPKDVAQAKRFYTIAAARGDILAAARLRELGP